MPCLLNPSAEDRSRDLHLWQSVLVVLKLWRGIRNIFYAVPGTIEMLGEFKFTSIIFKPVITQRSKVFTAAVTDEGCAGNNLNYFLILAQIGFNSSVIREAHYLALLVTDNSNRLLKRIACLNISAYNSLETLELIFNYCYF